MHADEPAQWLHHAKVHGPPSPAACRALVPADTRNPNGGNDISDELRPVDEADLAKISWYTAWSGRLVNPHLVLFGYQPPRPDGSRFATMWLRISGLPIIPRGRYLVSVRTLELGDSYRIVDTTQSILFLARSTLRPKEIALTYLWAWLFCPAVAILPELWFIDLAFGFTRGGNPSGWQAIGLILTMGAWPVVAVWTATYLRHRRQGLLPWQLGVADRDQQNEP